MKKANKFSILFTFLFVLLLFLSYKIISTYLIIILSAFVLAYLIKPVYNYLNKFLKKEISAIFSIILLIVLLVFPMYFIFKSLYLQLKSFIASQEIQFLFSKISNLGITDKFSLENIFNSVISKASSYIGETITKVPFLLLGLMIFTFGVYYILTNWEYLTDKLEKYLPMKDKNKKIKEIKKKTNEIVYAILLLGLLQAFISWAGFYALGVSNSLIFSVLIFFASILPGIGPGAIWMPLALYYLINGKLFVGISLIVIGSIVSYVIGIFLNSKYIGDRIKINPFLMLLGILGGIQVFGVFGFIIGPLILIYTLEFIEEFFKD